MTTEQLYITVPRADLINTMKARRTEIEKQFDDQIVRLNDEVAAIPRTTEALKEWHIEIGKMLTAGEVKVNAKGEFTAIGNVDVPDKPSTSTQRNAKKELEYRIHQATANKGQAIARLDASLRLLDLATDNEVRIPVSQYESMLASDVSWSNGYYYR